MTTMGFVIFLFDLSFFWGGVVCVSYSMKLRTTKKRRDAQARVGSWCWDIGMPRKDIAGACLFLCSKAGGYVTGTEFALDGGSLVCRTPKSSY